MSSNVIAGASVRETSRRLYSEATLRALLACLLVGLGVAIGANGAGGVGALAFTIGVLLAWEARKRARSARGYRLGAISEERVATILWTLERYGWLVEHDVQKRGGGNVDHVVQSPAVTFVIDTKRSRWSYADLRQAHRHADWAARHYGAGRQVVPVVCVQRSDREAELRDGVLVVGAGRVVSALLDRG